MKKIIVFLTLLTLGLFQVSECVANGKTVSKTVVLTDSILNAKIDSSMSVRYLRARLDSTDSTLQQHNKNIEELYSQSVPFWLLLLTFVNTIGVLCFVISKIKKGNKTKQDKTSQQNDDTSTKVDLTSNINSSSITRHNKTNSSLSSPTTYSDDDNSCNVVVTTYGKDESVTNRHQTGNKKQERRKTKLHRFANFMIDNGRISTLERTISDDSSDKLFAIDYEVGSNVATYTINPKCKAEILSDIQTFQNYVEKFSITGNPTDILVKKAGRLNKVGKQWVVIEKLVVEFK